MTGQFTNHFMAIITGKAKSFYYQLITIINRFGIVIALDLTMPYKLIR